MEVCIGGSENKCNYFETLKMLQFLNHLYFYLIDSIEPKSGNAKVKKKATLFILILFWIERRYTTGKRPDFQSAYTLYRPTL